MNGKLLGTALAVLAPLAAAAPLAAQDMAMDTMAVGRQATVWFLDGQMDSLWAMMTPEFQESTGSIDAMYDRLDQVSVRAGSEIVVIEESIRMRNGQPQYWRVAEFDLIPEPLLLRWVISPDGKVSGQGLGLASQPPKTDDEQ